MKTDTGIRIAGEQNNQLANGHGRVRFLFHATVAAIGIVAIVIVTFSALADVPQPVLTIAPLGSNQFSVTITNGDANANYELYWAPVLANPDYPFSLLSVGTQGQTNFSVDGSAWMSLWFRVSVGIDWDGDGIPNYMDAYPSDASIGALSVTIDSPINGSELN